MSAIKELEQRLADKKVLNFKVWLGDNPISIEVVAAKILRAFEQIDNGEAIFVKDLDKHLAQTHIDDIVANDRLTISNR